LDDVLDDVRALVPDLHVERLVGTWAADDDNVYWLGHGGVEVQIDTCEGGQPPFVVESTRGRFETTSKAAAAHYVIDDLGGEAT
jgi:hypothetical protein